jgi:hypothetical protein
MGPVVAGTDRSLMTRSFVSILGTMTPARVTRVALGMACAFLCGCAVALTDPTSSVSGIYSLEPVTGSGPAEGTLVLTRHGYAERRVRFRELDSTLSREYLARGTAEFRSDGVVILTLKAIDPASDVPWTPSARLTADVVQIAYDLLDGSTMVETYRRQ